MNEEEVSVDAVISLLSRNDGDVDGELRSTLFARTLQQVRALPLGRLFDAGKLNTLSGEHRLSSYLRALVFAFTARCAGEARSPVITAVYKKAVQLIQEGTKLYSEEQRQLTECLLSNAHSLSDEDCLSLFSKMFSSKWDFSNSSMLTALSDLLEIASRFTQRSNAEVRVQVHEQVMGFNGGIWPGCVTVMLVSAAVDASESQVECELALQRIRDCLQMSVVRSTGAIEPEELPTLLYHAVALGRKQGGSSVYLKSLVVDILTTSVDSILEQFGLSDVDVHMEVTSRGGASSSSQFSASNAQRTGSRFRVAPVLATIVHHLALLLAKDKGIATEVLSRVRCGFFLHGGLEVSLSTLMLCLLAALVPRHENTVINAMTEALVSCFSVASRYGAQGALHCGSSAGHWLPFSCADFVTTPRQLCHAFERLVCSPLMTEILVPPLIQLAISLLDVPAAASHVFTLLGPSRVPVRAHPFLNHKFEASRTEYSTNSPAGLGALILVNLFYYCGHARRNITRDLIVRLLTGTSSGMASSSTAAEGTMSQHISASAAGIAVSIFGRLAHRCPHGMLEVQGDLYEAFACLGDLPSTLAAGVVVALSPLFKNCSQLVDRCMMSVRKASFSRDAHCRQAAAASLVALMREQLLAQSGSAGASSSPRARPFRFDSEATMGISIEEGFALLRRFLQQQIAVQSIVYARVYLLQKEFSVVRTIALQLFLSHFRSLTCAVSNPNPAMNPIHGYADLSNDCIERLDLEACIDNTSQPVQRLRGLLCTLVTIAKTVLENAELTNRSFETGTHVLIDAEVLEAVEVCQCVWNIVKSCAKVDLADFSLEVDEGHDAPTHPQLVCRHMCFLDALHACAIIVYALPTSLGSGLSLTSKIRMQLCSQLTQRAHEVRTTLRKIQRDSQKLSKAAAGTSPVNAIRVSRVRAREVEDPLMLHSLQMEIRFAVAVLEDIYLVSEDPRETDVTDEEYHIDTLREGPRILVTRMALETAVCALDGLNAMVVSARACNVAKELECGNYMTETLGLPDSGALSAVLDEIPPLAVVLLRFLSVLTENEPSKKVAQQLGSAGMLSHLDQAQLVLRCILSLNRFGIDMTAMLVSSTEAPIVSIKDRVMQSLDVLLGSALKRLHMKPTAANHKEGVDLTSTLTAVYTAPPHTMKTADDVRHSYKKIWQAFSKGILRMPIMWFPSAETFESDQASNRLLVAASDRLCVALCCVAEVMAPISYEQRKDVCKKVLNDCKEKLEMPSPALAITLIELLTLATPETPQQRYEAVLQVATDIKTCAERCEEFFNEVGEEFMDAADQKEKDDADRSTRVGYLSLSTLPHAVSCLVGILERGAADVSTLLRLRDQRFSAAVQRRALNKASSVTVEKEKPTVSIVSSTSEESTNGSQGVDWQRHHLDTAIHEALGGLMEATKPLLIVHAGNASEKVLALLTKLFRILARIEKDFLAAQFLPASFRCLLKASSDLMTPAGDLIQTLQNQSVSGKKKKKKNATNKLATKSVAMPRQAKIVPELVYQLEQAEVQLVRLSTRNKIMDAGLASFLVPREQRSFQIGNENFNPKAKKRARED